MGSIAGDDAGGGKEERILVSVRIRPLSYKEIERHELSDWECVNENTLVFKNTVPERAMYPGAYTFDKVFGCDTSTKEVYEEGAREVALSVVNGINSSIFAYGQTSSGKTYTMTGITEYSVAEIYNYIEKHGDREFVLKFSAIEIYNEAVKDLLHPESGPLRLLDDPEKGTIVERLTEETLRDRDHLRELLCYCEAQRKIGETSLNEMSSRSHQILRLSIESTAREFSRKDGFSTLSATVNFIDLAGSERASQALTAGSRLKEGCHINRSLLTLGTVIRKLSKGRNGHVPYRDSKLTRILQSSLGGNARTAIICTMSPARSHIEQSRNTLQFASCAKEVVTSAHVNVVMSDKALVKHLRKELARLENELRYMGRVSDACPSDMLRQKDAEIKKMEKEMKEVMKQRDLAQSRLEDLLRSLGDESSGQWDEISNSLMPRAPITYEDTSSISSSSCVSYHIPERGARMYTEYDALSDCTDQHSQISSKPVARPSTSPMNHSASVPNFMRHKQISPSSSPGFDHCKEVRCIEMIEPNLNKSEEFDLLSEDIDSLLPPTPTTIIKDAFKEPAVARIALKVLTGNNEDTLKGTTDDKDIIKETADKKENPKVTVDTKEIPKELAKVNNTSEEPADTKDTHKEDADNKNTVGETIQKVHTDHKPTSRETIPPNEFAPLHPAGDLRSSARPPLVRSRSCRASLMTIRSSVWFEDLEEHKTTPSNSYLKDFPGRFGESEKKSSANNYDDEQQTRSRDGSENSDQDGCITRVSNSVDGLDEMIHIKQQKERANDQQEQTPSKFSEPKVTVKDVCLDPVSKSAESPSDWAMEFEKKQREIVELWHACNVSLIHRSCFFLLIKGDPADAIYMEVEHRRLIFLQKNTAEENINRDLSLKNIRREREKLAKLMNRLPAVERESLFKKWRIALDSKQRRVQLSQRVWTGTKDMEHVAESARLVAKLFGFLDTGMVPKEMFGLSFTLELTSRKSFNWKSQMSLRR